MAIRVLELLIMQIIDLPKKFAEKADAFTIIKIMALIKHNIGVREK